MTSNNETVSPQMPWASNIAKAMTSNGKQFTVTRSTVHCWPLLHLLAGISARFSNFAFVLFCYITNHLMTGPLGNGEFCFPRISMFPSTSSRETLRFEGNTIHSSPRDQSLSVPYKVLVVLTMVFWCGKLALLAIDVYRVDDWIGLKKSFVIRKWTILKCLCIYSVERRHF